MLTVIYNIIINSLIRNRGGGNTLAIIWWFTNGFCLAFSCGYLLLKSVFVLRKNVFIRYSMAGAIGPLDNY